MKLKPFLTVLLGLACAGVVAFAQDAEKKDSAKEETKAETKEESKDSETKEEAGEVTVLEITGNDALQYSTKELKVKAGEKVKLKLKHIGAMPKAAMGHNVVILKAGEDITAFAMKAVAAAADDYIPQDEDSQSKIIVATKMIGGGEETEVEFTAPEAGEYPYVCTFPGHFGAMSGKLIVE